MPSSEGTMSTAFMLLATCAAVLYTPVKAYTFFVKPGELQDALDKVQPGDTIEMADGLYYESIVSKRDGEPDKYITIHGASYNAILKGGEDGGDHIFDLQHSYYALDRFTIDGLMENGEYTDKCLYVQTNREHGREATEIEFNGHRFRSSINGLAIGNMDIRNCGGECIRLRYFITYAQVYNNRIEHCGTHDFVVDPNSGSKNGEGIYLGTSSTQWGDGKNPSDEPDQSQYNHFFGNHFETHGNEGLDIKEGSTNNLVENNYCTAQLDVESGCLDARGSGNIFRFNTIVGNLGAGVRLGGHEIDGYTYGERNDVYGNYMDDNEYAGVKILVGNQGKICDNKIEGSDDLVRGNEGEGVHPTRSCPTVDDGVDTASATRAPVQRKPVLSEGSFKPSGGKKRKEKSDNDE